MRTTNEHNQSSNSNRVTFSEIVSDTEMPPMGINAAREYVHAALMMADIEHAKKTAEMISGAGWGISFQFAEHGPCGICTPVYKGLKLGRIAYFNLAMMDDADLDSLFGPDDDNDHEDDDSFGPSFLDTEDDCGLF